LPLNLWKILYYNAKDIWFVWEEKEMIFSLENEK